MKRKAYKRRCRRNRARALLILAFILVALCSKSFAKSNKQQEAEIITYTISRGDTLWNIAQEYKSADCSTKEYIKEVMELNSLSTNKIQEGQHLMLAYYDNEFK